MEQSERCVLLLEDGTFIEGWRLGARGTTAGEICFTTSPYGYIESFTDPSYHRQILVMAAVHIGNYGAWREEMQSDRAWVAGVVVRRATPYWSRSVPCTSIDTFLKEEGVVGIQGVDTRALIKHIRERGAMRAVISSEIFDRRKLRKILEAEPPMQGRELASEVSTRKVRKYGEEGRWRVALLDYGVKQAIIEELVKRNCEVWRLPARTPVEELLALKPHGVLFSNGPGDPSAMDYAVEQATVIMEKGIPSFGICLGHQVMALAAGFKTYKMHHGHRGANHPVKDLLTDRCMITTQNHGFCVELPERVPHAHLSHINLNDMTLEGIVYRHAPAFSVQFHPEASPGPHDARSLFDAFIELMNGKEAQEALSPVRQPIVHAED